MDVIILLSVLGQCISKVYGQFYSYWLSSSSPKINDFYLYPSTKMRTSKYKLATYIDIEDIINDCLKQCRTNRDCFSLNIIKNNDKSGKHMCDLFSANNGTLIQTNTKRNSFYSKYPPACARGYCEELSYLKLCGTCKCHSLCNSKLPHYCDCTGVVKSSKIKDCSMAIKIGNTYPLSGLYYIDGIVEQTVRVMCQVFRPTVVEELWITIFRRLHEETLDFKRDRSVYEEGFNQPFQDNYFMGYKKIADLTTKENMTLGVAVISAHGEEKYIEYDNFKLIYIMPNLYLTLYSGVRCNDCLDNFLETDNWESCPSFDLFKYCLDDGKRIRLGSFKWSKQYRDTFLSSTFMLRLTKKNKVIKSSEVRTMKKVTNLGKVWGKMELCVKFDFKLPSLREYSLLRLGLWNYHISIFYRYFYTWIDDGYTRITNWNIDIVMSGSEGRYHYLTTLTTNEYHSLQLSFVKVRDKWFMKLKVNKNQVKIEWFPIPNFLSKKMPIYSAWEYVKHEFKMKNLYVNGERVF